jgi:hypothetical protein
MEAICSSETSVDFQNTRRRYIAGDRTFETTISHLKKVCEKFDEPHLCAQHLAPVIQVNNVVAQGSKEKQKLIELPSLKYYVHFTEYWYSCFWEV